MQEVSLLHNTFSCLFVRFFLYIVIQLSDDTYASLLSVMADIQYLKVTYTMLIMEGDLILKHLFLNQPNTHTCNPGQKYWRENRKKKPTFSCYKN